MLPRTPKFPKVSSISEYRSTRFEARPPWQLRSPSSWLTLKAFPVVLMILGFCLAIRKKLLYLMVVSQLNFALLPVLACSGPLSFAAVPCWDGCWSVSSVLLSCAVRNGVAKRTTAIKSGSSPCTHTGHGRWIDDGVRTGFLTMQSISNGTD